MKVKLTMPTWLVVGPEGGNGTVKCYKQVRTHSPIVHTIVLFGFLLQPLSPHGVVRVQVVFYSRLPGSVWRFFSPGGWTNDRY